MMQKQAVGHRRPIISSHERPRLSSLVSRPALIGARTFRLTRPGPSTDGGPAAGSITLIHRRNAPQRIDDVLLDRNYLPRTSWWADDYGTLHWRDPQTGNGGQLFFDASGQSGCGTEFVGGLAVPLIADLPPITYTCALAAGTGAYVVGAPPAL